MEKVAVVFCLLLFTSIAGAAAIDIAAVVDDLNSENSAIVAVATAVMLIYVGIKGIKFIRKVLAGG